LIQPLKNNRKQKTLFSSNNLRNLQLTNSEKDNRTDYVISIFYFKLTIDNGDSI
jgi:hypothetical protein